MVTKVLCICATDAYDSARFLCENYYNTAPQCDITCHSGWYKHYLVLHLNAHTAQCILDSVINYVLGNIQ